MDTLPIEDQPIKKAPFVSGSLLKNPFALTAISLLLIGILFETVLLSNEQKSVVTNAQVAPTNVLYVNPGGLDTNSGASPSAPLRTIQAALNKAVPGTTISLAEGIYRETLTTKIDGTAGAPITLKGPETGKDRNARYKAILYGGSGRIVNVNHSYYTFEGFTIDGQEALNGMTYPTALADVRPFKDAVQGRTLNNKLIYVGSDDATHDLTGIIINDMFLSGAGGECVRLRNRAIYNEIKNSVIQWCGMYASGDDSSKYKYHNAEGVYVGTSPKSTDQPMYANDAGAFNNIHDNRIHTYGAECFEVKENAHDNTFQNNDCRYNDETYAFLGANIELRGYNNKIIGNTIKGSRAVGLKMKSDSTSYTQGGNVGQNNAFSEIANESIRNDQSTAQGLFCGNTFTGTVLVGTSVGSPAAACPGQATPTPTNATPPTSTPTSAPFATPTPTRIPTATPTPIGADIQPPSVTITSPASGASLKKGKEITIQASASDNKGVTKVTFSINNTLQCTDNTASYTCNWFVPNKPNITYTIQARAYDAAGNSTATSINVISSN